MDAIPRLDTAGAAALPDTEVAARVLRGETALFEIIMRRYNQRLYRAARAIVRDDAEAEDVVQDAYVRAFAHLDQYAGRAAFGTWLTRIAVHEALARRRRRGRVDGQDMTAFQAPGDVEQDVGRRELGRSLEAAVDGLPEVFRTVFVLRQVEEMTTAETAAVLDVPEETVKTRLHRARVLLRRALEARVQEGARDAFAFGATRCDRVVAAVLARISQPTP